MHNKYDIVHFFPIIVDIYHLCHVFYSLMVGQFEISY
jgi:hypothetical protein